MDLDSQSTPSLPWAWPHGRPPRLWREDFGLTWGLMRVPIMPLGEDGALFAGAPFPRITVILVAGNSSQAPPFLVISLAGFSPPLMPAAPASSTRASCVGGRHGVLRRVEKRGTPCATHAPRSTEGWFPGHLPQLCPPESQGLPTNPRTPEGLVPHERGRLRSDRIGDVGKPQCGNSPHTSVHVFCLTPSSPQ